MGYPKPRPRPRPRPRPKRLKPVHLFGADFVCRAADGAVLWREPAVGFMLNRLFNEGEKVVGEQFFRSTVYGSLGALLFGRLYNDTPTDADQLSDLTGEPASNGYQPIPWSRNTTDFGAPTLVGGQTEWLALKKTFNATGAGWGPVIAFVFATTSDNAGKPVGWFMLSQPRTVPGGAGLDIQPRGMIRGVTA